MEVLNGSVPHVTHWSCQTLNGVFTPLEKQTKFVSKFHIFQISIQRYLISVTINLSCTLNIVSYKWMTDNVCVGMISSRNLLLGPDNQTQTWSQCHSEKYYFPTTKMSMNSNTGTPSYHKNILDIVNLMKSSFINVTYLKI